MLQKQTRRWKLPCAVSLHRLLRPGSSSCYRFTHNPHQLCERTCSLLARIWNPASTFHCPGEGSCLFLRSGFHWPLSANWARATLLKLTDHQAFLAYSMLPSGSKGLAASTSPKVILLTKQICFFFFFRSCVDCFHERFSHVLLISDHKQLSC